MAESDQIFSVTNTDDDIAEMLGRVGVDSVDELFANVPEKFRLSRSLDVPAAASEQELLSELTGGDHVRLP